MVAVALAAPARDRHSPYSRRGIRDALEERKGGGEGKGEGRTVGLMNPMGFLPTASRASFTIVRMEPTTGAEAEVPNTRANLPFT